MITGLNHITFAVADLDRATTFYRDILGASLETQWSNGAYLELGGVWICLSLDPLATEQPRTDYTHTAFSVSSKVLNTFEARFAHHGVTIWKENKSEGDSIYFLDPDGHKLELHVGNLQTRLAHMVDNSSYADSS